MTFICDGQLLWLQEKIWGNGSDRVKCVPNKSYIKMEDPEAINLMKTQARGGRKKNS